MSGGETLILIILILLVGINLLFLNIGLNNLNESVRDLIRKIGDRDLFR